MKFVYTVGDAPDFAAYMLDRLDLDLRGQNLSGPNWFCVTVREDVTGHIVAGLACEFKSPFEAHFSAAIDEPEAITRVLLRGIFAALFTKATRVTALVDPENHEGQDRVIRLGFVYEGFLRRGLDGDRDAMIFGMLREDCRYLPGVRAVRANGEKADGQPAQSPGSLRHRVGPATGQRRVVGGQRYH